MPRTRHEKRYRKVFSEIYADDKFGELTPIQPSGQALFLYLLTGPHCTNLPGVIACGRAGLAEALGWELDAFDRCFAEIESRGMALADWKRRVVWLPNAIKHNVPDNPNVVKGWAAAWREVPQCDLKDQAARAILSCLGAHLASLADAFVQISGVEVSGEPFAQPLPKPFPERLGTGFVPDTHASRSRLGGNQDQEQDQEQEEEPTPIHKPDDVSPTQPSAAPARLRDVAPVERARRPHTLDEPPLTTAVMPESLQLLDEFLALYPRKDSPRKALHEAWLALNPSVALAQKILANLRAKLAAGWPEPGTPMTKVKTAVNWLREEHWTIPPPASAPSETASLEGRGLTGECEDCGAPIRGVIRNGVAVYDTCTSCVREKVLAG